MDRDDAGEATRPNRNTRNWNKKKLIKYIKEEANEEKYSTKEKVCTVIEKMEVSINDTSDIDKINW